MSIKYLFICVFNKFCFLLKNTYILFILILKIKVYILNKLIVSTKKYILYPRERYFFVIFNFFIIEI